MKGFSRHIWDQIVRVHNTFEGQIDGVTFDFRHPELPPKSWQMASFLGDYPGSISRPSCAPFFWFPWFGQFSKNRVTKSINQEIKKFPAKDVPEAEQRTAIERLLIPDIIVERGDALTLFLVKSVEIGGGLRYMHDNEIRYGFVELTRKDGEKIFVEEPIEFTGTLSMMRGGKIRFLETLTARVRDHFGVQSLLEDKRLNELLADDNFSATHGAAGGALIESHFLLSAYKKFVEAEEKARLEEGYSDRWREMSSAASAINKACLVGYLWAYAEADIKMKPLAQAALASRQGASQAGRKSGESRKALAQTTWEPIALKLAREHRKATPNLSQDALAMRIEESLRDTKNAKEHATIKRFISRMERTGQLPVRERRSRVQTNGVPIVDVKR